MRVQGKKREREEAALPEGWVDFDAGALAAADAAVEHETATVRAAMGHAGKTDEEYAEAWAAVAGDFIFLPGKGGASQVRRMITACVLFQGSMPGPGAAPGVVLNSRVAKDVFTIGALIQTPMWVRSLLAQLLLRPPLLGKGMAGCELAAGGRNKGLNCGAQGRYLRAASATNTDRLEAVQAEYSAARAEMEKEAVRAAKLEQRLNVLTGGYAAREANLRAGIEEAWAAERATQQVRGQLRPCHVCYAWRMVSSHKQLSPYVVTPGWLGEFCACMCLCRAEWSAVTSCTIMASCLLELWPWFLKQKWDGTCPIAVHYQCRHMHECLHTMRHDAHTLVLCDLCWHSSLLCRSCSATARLAQGKERALAAAERLAAQAAKPSSKCLHAA